MIDGQTLVIHMLRPAEFAKNREIEFLRTMLLL
jgi:hypothetical protein